MREVAARARLDGDTPELVVVLRAEGEMDVPLPALTVCLRQGQLLILPVNEGIGYPVDDEALPPMHYYLYGGHGLCMPGTGRWKVMPAGWPYRDTGRRGSHHPSARWPARPRFRVGAAEAAFGPERAIRYFFLDGGGYVAMAKRYREYAKQTGLFKTLIEKRKAVPGWTSWLGR